ncbi:MAG: PAS domain S-box protein [Myxococcales bacterium]|nr:PAS domain S-box protein [Myxococcales bacterium]
MSVETWSRELASLGDVLESLGVGVSLVDRGLRLVWTNQRGATAERRDCTTGSHCFAAHWGRSARCGDCLPVLVFRTGEAHEGYRERQAPGEARRVMRVRAIPICDASGELTHVLESFVDLTDFAFQASPALVGERLSSSLAVAGHGMYVVDPQRRIVSWSPGMTAILGHHVDEILGRDELTVWPRATAHAGADGERRETTLVARDGREVPAALSTTVIRDGRGEVCGYQTIVEDLSEVARLRSALRTSEQALGELVRTSADAIFAADAEGRITSWNQGAAAMLGYEAREARALDLAHLLCEARAAELLESARAGGRLGSVRETLRHRSGRRVVVETTWTPLQQPWGFAGVSAIGRDVAERERVEQQMIRSEKLAAVGSLAAGLAHEIGTPLNVISASTEYLLLDLPTSDPRREELVSIVDETDRIRRLVSDLLGFARGGTPRRGATQPRAAVERVVRLLHLQLDKRQVRCEMDVEAELPAVDISEDALHQVLLNVLMNALAAAPERGRVHIRLSPVPPGTVDGERARARVRFAVSDDGPGIPAPLRQRIFDPFFTTRPDGTGLGLTVCNRIVTDCGGAIHVGESALGGALVEIALPVASDEEGP